MRRPLPPIGEQILLMKAALARRGYLGATVEELHGEVIVRTGDWQGRHHVEVPREAIWSSMKDCFPDWVGCWHCWDLGGNFNIRCSQGSCSSGRRR